MTSERHSMAVNNELWTRIRSLEDSNQRMKEALSVIFTALNEIRNLDAATIEGLKQFAMKGLGK